MPNLLIGLAFLIQLLIIVVCMFVNEGKSAASFCLQVAAWVSDMLYNFYFVKNHKIADDSRTTKAREKNSTDLESIELKEFFDV